MPEPRAHPRVAVGAVLIEQRDGAPVVLLVRRARAPMMGQWSLPGGRVEFGERLADALAREVLEETGLRVRPGRLVEVVEVIDAEHHYVIHDFACERTGGELRAGDDASEVAMAPVFDLANYAVSPAVLRVVSRAIADGDERD